MDLLRRSRTQIAVTRSGHLQHSLSQSMGDTSSVLLLPAYHFCAVRLGHGLLIPFSIVWMRATGDHALWLIVVLTVLRSQGLPFLPIA